MEEISQEDPKIFSVRIVSIDYYMARPIPGLDISYSSFQGGKVNEVPVVRVYGSTPAGQKTCLHIHRALPYLYVPCSDLNIHTDKEGEACMNTVSLAIEKALKLKSNAGSKRQHVHGCSLVRAKKFYGYHSSEELFLKIYLYYPQDVSRTANLLLGGAVLDMVLQPHESHIPFLLQFLVDYNLYGMGLLHVSKMKFRHPVPKFCSPRKPSYVEQQEQLIDNSMAAGFQEHESGGACPVSSIWISSTIPDSWYWQCPSQPESSTDQDISLVKRQSTSELEGDATVDEILNQQFTSYASLSQTGSEVRMVQSLIPIWEEEHERSGVHAAGIPPDPGKPLPEDVLRILSHGIDWGNLLMELNYDAIDIPPITPIESAAAASAFKNEDSGNASGMRETDLQQLQANELQIPEINGSPNVKASDPDALGLLKWLASSQAVEDINSDDELARETILSPLLPSATIDKVLEKANIDYEYESQQECRDILDSVDDLGDTEGLNKLSPHSTDHDHSRKTSSTRTIPQVDGAGDDPNWFSSPGETSEKRIDNRPKASSQVHSHQDVCSLGSNSELKRRKPQWGSLPVSSREVTEYSSSHLVHMVDTCDLSSKDHEEHSALTVFKDGEDENSSKQQTNVIAQCSMRDLMRKKRCHKFGMLESRTELFFEEQRRTSEIQNNEQDNGHPGSPTAMQRTLTLTDVQMESLEKNVCRGLDVCGEPNALKANMTSLTFGKLPISSGSHNTEPVKTSREEASNSCQLLDCKGVTEATASLENIREIGEKSSFNNAENWKSEFHVEDVGGCENIKIYAKSDPRAEFVKFDADIDRHGTKKFPENVYFSSSCQPGETTREYDSILINGENREVSMLNLPETSAISSDVVVRYSANWDVGPQQSDTGVSGPLTSMSTVVNNEPTSAAVNTDRDHLEPIGMTIVKRNPTVWVDEGEKNPIIASPSIFCHPHVDEEGTKAQDVLPDECLPFYRVDSVEEPELRNSSCMKSEYPSCSEAVMGVPLHFQNDGSYLYMLTPALSPPSSESVNRWVSLYGPDILEKNMVGETSSPQSAAGSSDHLVGLQNFQYDVPDLQIQECDFSSDLEPSSEKVLYDRYDRENVKMEHLNAGVIVKQQKEVVDCKPSVVSLDDISQISGPDGKSKLTPLSQSGFRDPASVGGGQQLTLLSIELQAESRGDLRPDPRFDAINIIVLVIQEDNDSKLDAHVLLRCNLESCQNLDGVSGHHVLCFSEEKHLFSYFMKLIGSFDPDILMGWDVQGSSLGYLAERAAHLGIGLLSSISRTPPNTDLASRDMSFSGKEMPNDVFGESITADSVPSGDVIIEDEWGRTHASGVHVSGRIVLNIWRLMRSEVRLNMYTIEAVADAVLRRKIPFINCKVLTKWFSSGPGRARFRCIEYILERAKMNLQIMNQLDMINRTSELARVFGIDFFSVLSRGSQFRVESMFLRLAHTQNYLAISPGNQQVAYQPAMECIPLVMEPESGFYADPVVVLDFQSLYPSMIIAYNLCFCTCLGKVSPSNVSTLGVSSYSRDTNVFQTLKHELLLTPNGVMYVPSKIRKGVLPRLLEEILSTRVMVKQAMKKLAPSQQVLHRIFNARQLALKLIANVTYGYTAAGFSGRMPCAELADSIVQCARRTLEDAISFVNSHDKWEAKVIYGDTDSMFVLLKGRSLKEAFQIGQEIASSVSGMNPSPVVLKLEKVYQPCFLLTKKRYVGYSYESPDHSEPTFDAKGIETVRRDTCGAVAKMLEKSLRLFFEHQNINKVRAYLERQWTRILSGRVSHQDFVFAKEVRLGTYSSRASSLPPAAIVATKAMRVDPRAEPRYAERIPYVVVHGEPGGRLYDMVVDPLDLLAIDSPFRLNDIYYIKKQIIPALQRVCGLVGADLNQWFTEMPRPGREAVYKHHSFAPNPHRTRIDFYYLSRHCILCGELVQSSTHLCHNCSKNKAAVATLLTGKTSKLERNIQHLAAICRHCGGGDWLIDTGVKCTSLACSVFYERRKVQKELQSLSKVATEAGFYPMCMVEWF